MPVAVNPEAVLTGWNAKRAGGRITVTHSCGKVANVDRIYPHNGKIYAVAANGSIYELDLGKK